MKAPVAAALTLLAAPLAAQDICEGNGLGNVYIEATPALIGGTYEFDMGSPDLPGGLSILSYSDGFGPTTLPLLGTVCLDVFSPTYNILALPLDGAGNVGLTVAIPADPTLAGIVPFYVAPATVNGAVVETGKTVPVYFENADSYTPTSDMSFARSMHRATALGQDARDNRIQVFISGGGDGTIFAPGSTSQTELFQPLDRTFSNGPALSTPRAFHNATLLEDGRVLITGGCNANGIVTATCDLYDHTTGTISAAAPMSTGRIGHSATRLADGRVLVAGGLSDYQNAETALAAVLNTAQDTAEVYDPSTDSWTSVSADMASVRSGHAAVLMPDDRVLLISGINGGVPSGIGTEVPTFTGSCEYYDPGTDSFSPAPSFPLPRGFPGASMLGNDDVLVTGGLITAGAFGEALATSTCYTFDGAAWTLAGTLTEGVAFHAQATTRDGNAYISGGYIGDFVTLIASTLSGTHDGTSFTAGTALGTNAGLPGNPASARGSHTLTELWDGSFLVLGGFNSPDTSTLIVLDGGYVYTP
ncbi:MAG: kelch repeat-containing protein [Planctomycetota bacterium]